MDPITQGLSLSAVGLTLSFLSMGLFILTIVVLQRIFPPKQHTDDKEEGGEIPAVTTQATDEEGQVVAAIAVAVSYARSKGQSQLGQSLQGGRSSWWIANRMSSIQDEGLHRK
jgi:Na+-transporting methylmalonyl-CoA/oxaloacetate decarboxylase gamma subunit